MSSLPPTIPLVIFPDDVVNQPAPAGAAPVITTPAGVAAPAPVIAAPAAAPATSAAAVMTAPSLESTIRTVDAVTGAAGQAIAVQADVDANIPTFTTAETVPDLAAIPANTTNPREQQMLVQQRWRYQPLYKYDANGKLRMWWVGVDYKTQDLITKHGEADGKLQESRAKIELNNSGRNFYQQSVLQANHEYLLKYRNNGYRPPGMAPPQYDKPMLANIWKETALPYPVYVQPKLDGMRMLVHVEGNGTISYRSRGNRALPHLNAEFDPELSVFFSMLPLQVDLDGEIYIQGQNFQNQTRAFKNERKPHALIKELVYWIFDFNSSQALPYSQRYTILMNTLQQFTALYGPPKRFGILNTYVANNKDEVLQWHRVFTNAKFEGTIIRKADAVYKPGKGNSILKFKDIQDAEGTIVGIADAKGQEAGAALLIVRMTHKNKDGVSITSDITMRPSYTIEQRREWFADPSLVLGKLATYTYQEITDDGKPRFPELKAIRDYE